MWYRLNLEVTKFSLTTIYGTILPRYIMFSPGAVPKYGRGNRASIFGSVLLVRYPYYEMRPKREAVVSDGPTHHNWIPDGLDGIAEIDSYATSWCG